MKYEVGQVFIGPDDVYEIIEKVWHDTYKVSYPTGYSYIDERQLEEFVQRGLWIPQDASPLPFAIGDRVSTKNHSIFTVKDYECVEGYLRGQPVTGSPQILKISGLTKIDDQEETEVEVGNEMVSLNEVCEFLRGKLRIDYYFIEALQKHFAEKKLAQDPEYQEYLRLKEKFDG